MAATMTNDSGGACEGASSSTKWHRATPAETTPLARSRLFLEVGSACGALTSRFSSPNSGPRITETSSAGALAGVAIALCSGDAQAPKLNRDVALGARNSTLLHRMARRKGRDVLSSCAVLTALQGPASGDFHQSAANCAERHACPACSVETPRTMFTKRQRRAQPAKFMRRGTIPSHNNAPLPNA